MRLKECQSAPIFEVEDIFKNPITLKDYTGKKLMVSFYRYASCPLCNLRVHNLIKNYPSLHGEKGLDMLAFFQSPKESILEYVGKQDAPFSIIADPKREVYKLYGVESSIKKAFKGPEVNSLLTEAMNEGFKPGKMEGERALIPADFLIGPDLTIKKAFYGEHAGDHLPIEDIELFLNSVK